MVMWPEESSIAIKIFTSGVATMSWKCIHGIQLSKNRKQNMKLCEYTNYSFAETRVYVDSDGREFGDMSMVLC